MHWAVYTVMTVDGGDNYYDGYSNADNSNADKCNTIFHDGTLPRGSWQRYSSFNLTWVLSTGRLLSHVDICGRFEGYYVFGVLLGEILIA